MGYRHAVFSSPRGEKFGPRGYGHTGFTGTSVWIDPDLGMFVIVLTSRLHPDGQKKSPTQLRREVATIVGESDHGDAPCPIDDDKIRG